MTHGDFPWPLGLAPAHLQLQLGFLQATAQSAEVRELFSPASFAPLEKGTGASHLSPAPLPSLHLYSCSMVTDSILNSDILSFSSSVQLPVLKLCFVGLRRSVLCSTAPTSPWPLCSSFSQLPLQQPLSWPPDPPRCPAPSCPSVFTAHVQEQLQDKFLHVDLVSPRLQALVVSICIFWFFWWW